MVFVHSTQMHSSDPLYPNDFYLQQDFRIITDNDIQLDESNFTPQCISSGDQIFKCYHAGAYTLSLNNREINFQILEEKRTYRWSFSIFERSSNSISQEPTRFIEQGKSYSLRIWITQLSFDPNIQKELSCTSSEISDNSKKVTLSFYSLGEFPIVSFTEFDTHNIEPVIFNNQYWEVNFTVNSTFLRSLTIKGHDNSNIFDVVSQISFNFQYKYLISQSSQLFSDATQDSLLDGHIVSINSIPCYPNYAIATVINNDSPPTKKFFFTNDSFTTVYEFGKNKGFLDAYLTINGVYYIDDNQRVRKLDNSGDIDVGLNFNNDPPIGFFSSNQCDFFRSYGNQISYENKFIGVFSSKKVAFSYDGSFFRDDFLLNKLNLTFVSITYKWQSLTILALDSVTDDMANKHLESNKKIKENQNSKDTPFIVNYDLTNHMASRLNLPFKITSGNVAYGSEYGFFVTGNNLLFSPDSRSVSSIFLPGHFQSNQDTYITSFIQQGNEFVATASDGSSFCGNYKSLKANQIFNTPQNSILFLDCQNNIVSVSIDQGEFTTIPVMHYIESEISSYSSIINGKIVPKYLDSGDFAITNLTIAAISKSETSILIMPPKNTILSYQLYSENSICSTLATYINRHIDITANVKTSPEFCTSYYISTRAIAISSYQLQSRRGQGGEEGSTRLQIYLYSNGKVFDVYNLPLIFGCSPKRRLGIKMHNKICYPEENGGNCLFNVFYDKYFKPIPLIFDDDTLIGEASFDFALITNEDVKYKMTVSDAKCLRAPQTYGKMGEEWSRNTYESCFYSSTDDDKDKVNDVSDDDYTILNLTSNEVKITKRKTKYVEFKLINLGSSSTMCQLEYKFKVKVLERPISPGFIVLIVIIGCIVVVNAMIYEYWQYIMFMYTEAVEINSIKEAEIRQKKEEKEEERKRRENENQPNANDSINQDTDTQLSINQTDSSDFENSSNISVAYQRESSDNDNNNNNDNESRVEDSPLVTSSKNNKKMLSNRSEDEDDDVASPLAEETKSTDKKKKKKDKKKAKITNKSEDEDDDIASLLGETTKSTDKKKKKNKKDKKKAKNTNKSEGEVDDNDNDDDEHEKSEDENSSNIHSDGYSLDEISASADEKLKKESEFKKKDDNNNNNSDEIEEEEEDKTEPHDTVV